MKKFRKWLIDRFLPRWAYESLLEELAAANKKQEELRQTRRAATVLHSGLEYATAGTGHRLSWWKAMKKKPKKKPDKCRGCPWRAATDYCLWPRCFRKITLGGKHDGRSDPRTDKQRSRKH